MPKQTLITHSGVTLSIKDWAAKLGIKRVTLSARLGRYGMSPALALTSESLAIEASGNHYPVISVGVGKTRREHIVLAEKALGRPLPRGAEVHHVDEDITNNAPGNLVICPNHAYHKLLHMRAEAFAACGHYDWRKCCYCGIWDSLDALIVNKQNSARHRTCHNAYHQQLRASRAKE